MAEANRFAICFLSVISFPLTFRWPKEELDFFPLIFLIAFQTVLGLVFDVSEEQKPCHDVSFWVFIVCLALVFSCSGASTFSAEGFRKSFRWTFLRSLIACLQTSFRKLVFRNAGFWNSFVRNLNQSICKLSHWILRQGQLVRQPRHTQSAEG